jgi:hypothetical protein
VAERSLHEWFSRQHQKCAWAGNLNELKLEVAIAEVEDLIMPMIRCLPANVKLEIHGAELVEIGQLLSEHNGTAISIEAVEHLFNQLAHYASGARVTWPHRVPATQISPGLVVLREVMQHVSLRSVSFTQQAE